MYNSLVIKVINIVVNDLLSRLSIQGSTFSPYKKKRSCFGKLSHNNDTESQNYEVLNHNSEIKHPNYENYE